MWNYNFIPNLIQGYIKLGFSLMLFLTFIFAIFNIGCLHLSVIVNWYSFQWIYQPYKTQPLLNEYQLSQHFGFLRWTMI